MSIQDLAKKAVFWRRTQISSNLVHHAERELAKMLSPEADEMDRLMAKQLMAHVALFDSHDHSGMSAGYAVHCLQKLLTFSPLGPLTGEDDEWVEVGTGVFQNRRCGRVFKQANRFDGQAYDTEGKVFEGLDGRRYTNSRSFVPITFPYVPTTELVKDLP